MQLSELLDTLQYKGTYLKAHSTRLSFTAIWSYWPSGKHADSKTNRFFKFLFSGETDLDKFEARKHKL
jgi:hypothetical protein